MNLAEIFNNLGLDINNYQDGTLLVTSPADGQKIGSLKEDSVADVSAKVGRSAEAFNAWKQVPAPVRGELVRRYGEKLRENKEALSCLVTAECGKILEEGRGEVQEMIDICDFAVGLSRQLYGLSIASERPQHRMTETWLPLGPVGIISAFNFPVAVWAWNTALALVCGDPVIWKPSEKTPFTAIACQHLFDEVVADFKQAPEGLAQLIIGGREVGEALVGDERVSLVSATGSTAMGRIVGPKVAARFGKTILELGGNNAIIVAPSADLDMAITGIVFGSVGTCGQRCTSTRRLFVHESIYDNLVPRLKAAYSAVTIGQPLETGTLVGPLIDEASFKGMEKALAAAKADGGVVHGGGRTLEGKFPNAFYVNPALVEMDRQSDVVKSETFAPILYVMKYSDLDDAIHMQNDVPQGLSSSIFTTDLREGERFTSATGSDCGIANVNIGTSGAEIGGAFGGEKETGGGRESGSDAWKAYMRRSTSTVNYSKELPLAQGIKFDLG
jgi:aldehyde dehydrogenase (NAD+)